MARDEKVKTQWSTMTAMSAELTGSLISAMDETRKFM